MTRFTISTAVAALMTVSAAPAFSAAHADLSDLTCSDFRAMSEGDQAETAMMILEEVEGGGESMRDTARATEATGEETSEEAADDADADTGTVVDNEGTATATEGTDDIDRETTMEADMERIMVGCDRNLDARVIDVASGMDTNR